MKSQVHKSVLYVDDEEANLFLFKACFSRTFNVLTANSGEKGLSILNENGNDIPVVISDMRMPLMDGVQFIKKAHEKYDNISYIILTGFEFNEEIERAIKAGYIKKYMTKPYDVDELEQVIHNLLEG